ncbi:MAG: 4Fe-4S dicluster domain-containing protein [Magnetococcales bacterium]|nr:4Fe-4S dicluster domain-containing protein [Magnetococcales bacterium]
MVERAISSRTAAGMSRRRVLRHAALLVAVLACGGMGRLPLAKATPFLRPPGAVPEHAFLSSCIKCGQCLQVCPVKAIELADIDQGYAGGTPYIAARDQACDFSCDALQCILACPTGALDHRLTKPAEVRMGLAVLTAPESCLATKNRGFTGHPRGERYRGLLRYAEIDRWKPQPVREHPYDRPLCDLCVVACPIKGAISLETRKEATGRVYAEPVVHASCTGCGVCEMICPTATPSITVVPRKVWQQSATEPGHG